MFYNHHFIGMHWIWWIILTIVILPAVFNIIPWSSAGNNREEAREILRKRFARGEIEGEEFEERKRLIEESWSD